jgi:hypothetical protein
MTFYCSYLKEKLTYNCLYFIIGFYPQRFTLEIGFFKNFINITIVKKRKNNG